MREIIMKEITIIIHLNEFLYFVKIIKIKFEYEYNVNLLKLLFKMLVNEFLKLILSILNK